MRQLHDFLSFGGAEWTGHVPRSQGLDGGVENAADLLLSRSVRTVLEHIARSLPDRQDRIHRGVQLGWAALGNLKYKRSSVLAAIALLVRAGIIHRERSRVKRDLHEAVARTRVNPVLIEAAERWNESKLAGRTERIRIQLPLTWTAPPGNPPLARTSAEQRPKFGSCSVQTLDGGFDTPPAGGDVQAVKGPAMKACEAVAAPTSAVNLCRVQTRAQAAMALMQLRPLKTPGTSVRHERRAPALRLPLVTPSGAVKLPPPSGGGGVLLALGSPPAASFVHVRDSVQLQGKRGLNTLLTFRP